MYVCGEGERGKGLGDLCGPTFINFPLHLKITREGGGEFS